MAALLPAERLSAATPVASRAERLATLAVTSLVPVVTLHLEMPKVATGVPLAMVVMHTAVPSAMLTEVMFSTAMENSSAEAVLAVVPPVVVLVVVLAVVLAVPEVLVALLDPLDLVRNLFWIVIRR